MKEKKFVSKLHSSTKRNYLERMINDKVFCMKIAKKYGQKYWDGERKYGYGGYKYIKNRWKPVALNLIKTYKLNSNSKVLDIGCGKGYLLYEIKKIIPKIQVFGFDISKYGVSKSKKEIKKFLFLSKAQKKYSFKKNYFDLSISLGVLHNLSIKDLSAALKEIDRVSKKSYVMVESYRNDKELFNLQCWALTCQSFFSKNDWKWLFKKFKYKGDYEFIYFT